LGETASIFQRKKRGEHIGKMEKEGFKRRGRKVQLY